LADDAVQLCLAICEVVIDRRSQRIGHYDRFTTSSKKRERKTLTGQGTFLAESVDRASTCYHSVVEFLESGITARGVALSDFVVLEVFCTRVDLTAAEIAKKTRLAAASVEIQLRAWTEQKF